MPTLGELMQKFGSAASANTPTTGQPPARQPQPAATGGETKLASGGSMNTLQDIYLTISGQDHVKQASQAAYSAPQFQEEDDNVDFAAMAEKIAEAEAGDEVAYEDGQEDIIKIAAEYDSAGRIMARGFYDEFCKLAEGVIQAPDNQNTETQSAAKTPALGERGLPTLDTNYAGTGPLVTTGTEGKTIYADSLAPTKTISAGQGTGTDPEAAAMALGGGAPLGFATIRDLQA